MACHVLIVIMIALSSPQWAKTLRPSVIDLKALELLYREGLQETNELIRLAKIPIENIMAAGKLNVSRQIESARDRVLASPGANSECAKIHASNLEERVKPEFLNGCSYYNVLEDAKNKWNAVEAHIVFCSMSSSSVCVDEIKKEIKDLRAANSNRIPEAVKLSESCKSAHCDGVVRIIAEIDQSYYKCLQ